LVLELPPGERATYFEPLDKLFFKLTSLP
jgi:hypothetical protein